MYYIVKLKWQEPKEGTDQMKKVTKQFLVNALSVTEAELRVNTWVPSNYQDAVVEEVKKTPIVELMIKGDAENYWLVKLLDSGGDDKAKPFLVVLNGLNLEDAVKVIKSDFAFVETLAVSKFAAVVDDDLISDVITK